MIWVSPKKRLPLTIALLIGLIVVGTIVAHARGPKPTAGATYRGTVVVETGAGKVSQRLAISFTINGSGTRVQTMRFPDGLPTSCDKPKLGTLAPAAPVATIVTPSRFTARLAITSTPAGASGSSGHSVGVPLIQRIGTLVISGVFHTFGRESGAVVTTFTPTSLRDCGASGGYNARAAAS